MGASTMTFESGYFLNLSAATRMAIIVFPSPVGSTTSVLVDAAASAIFCWYSRGSKPAESKIFLCMQNQLKALPSGSSVLLKRGSFGGRKERLECARE